MTASRRRYLKPSKGALADALAQSGQQHNGDDAHHFTASQDQGSQIHLLGCSLNPVRIGRGLQFEGQLLHCLFRLRSIFHTYRTAQAPSSVENETAETSTHPAGTADARAFRSQCCRRTSPATTTVLAFISGQVTRPVSPTTSRPRMAISPSKVPSMRIPPLPRKLPFQIMPGPQDGRDAFTGDKGRG